MNIMNMMKQAKDIQKRMQNTTEELAKTELEGTAGGGAVKVVCTGQGKFKSIKLSAEAINPENPSSVDSETIEMLEDMITTAVNIAGDKATKIMDEKMKAATGGLNIPGISF